MNAKEVITHPQTERVLQEFIHRFWSDKQKLPESSVLQDITDTQIEKLKNIGIPQEGRPVDDVVREMADEIFKYRHKVNHPRYLGFVPGPASSLSWLGEVMTSAYNLHAGSWMNCPAANCIEQELLGWFCKQAGYTGNPGGIFVSGGSMANMTALIAARNKVLPDDKQHLGAPRKGSSEEFLSILIKTKPSRIVYVSCDPATLARDLKYLSSVYDIVSVNPVDMFPHTFHVENVVLLSKKNG